MIKAIILLTRRDDMTRAEFANWWLGEHAPLAVQLPGVRRIVFNLVDDGGDDAGDTNAPDGISELWFDSEADLEAAYASDLGRRVAADSMAHVSGRVRMLVSEHAIISA